MQTQFTHLEIFLTSLFAYLLDRKQNIYLKKSRPDYFLNLDFDLFWETH